MPHAYNIIDDGKIHTRYSELNDCRIKSPQSVIKRRSQISNGIETQYTYFGSVRHEMFAKESSETKKIPQTILQHAEYLSDIDIDIVEKEYKAEIFKDIVLHSAFDAVSTKKKVLIDYKTGTIREGKKGYANKYLSTMQLPVYAYMLRLHGIEIKELIYIVELWNLERNKFIGYDVASKFITEKDYEITKLWLKERCKTLIAILEMIKTKQLI